MFLDSEGGHERRSLRALRKAIVLNCWAQWRNGTHCLGNAARDGKQAKWTRERSRLCLDLAKAFERVTLPVVGCDVDLSPHHLVVRGMFDWNLAWFSHLVFWTPW